MRGDNIILELGMGGVYLLILIFLVHFYAANKKGDEYQYLKWGFTAKLIGGFAFGLVYMFYYGYGDTFYYHECARVLRQIIAEDPIYGIKLVFNQVKYFRAQDYLYNEFVVNYFRGNDTFTVIKIGGFISLIGIGGFFTTTLLYSCFAFFGQWKLYQTFIEKYPNQKLSLAIAHFFIPSVIFWGSGIMKDSLVIGFLGILIHYLDKAITKGKIKLGTGIIITMCVYFIFVIKGYIIIAFLPAFITWIFFRYGASISSNVIKFIIFPILLVSVFISSFYSFTLLETIDAKYSTTALLSQADVYQSNHYSESGLDGTGSGYSLGEYQNTISGIVQQVIPAIVVTLFRPFPWEIKTPIMAFTALESLAFLLFTIYVIVKIKISRIFKILGSNSFILMSTVFCLILAFIVGFSSYNFGALARYKIPCLPFYSSILIILLSKEVKQTRKTTGFAYRKK